MPHSAAGSREIASSDIAVLCTPKCFTFLHQCTSVTVARQLHQTYVYSISGPDSFTRSLAARQLAFLIRQLDYQHLTSVLQPALPYVIASVKDPSPNVQCYGLQALRHLATGVIHC